MTLRPMADNVLLKQNEANETTVGGIILATATKEKPAIYAVVAVGPGTKDTEMLVKVGDKVVMPPVLSYLGGMKTIGYTFRDAALESLTQAESFLTRCHS